FTCMALWATVVNNGATACEARPTVFASRTSLSGGEDDAMQAALFRLVVARRADRWRQLPVRSLLSAVLRGRLVFRRGLLSGGLHRGHSRPRGAFPRCPRGRSRHGRACRRS